jgi:hypothetical protein
MAREHAPDVCSPLLCYLTTAPPTSSPLSRSSSIRFGSVRTEAAASGRWRWKEAGAASRARLPLLAGSERAWRRRGGRPAARTVPAVAGGGEWEGIRAAAQGGGGGGGGRGGVLVV